MKSRRRFIFDAAKGLMVPFASGQIVRAATIMIRGPQPIVASGSPAWTEAERATPVVANNAAQTFTLGTGVASGKLAVAVLGWEGSPTVTSVQDSQGNTWNLRGQRQVSSVHNTAIADFQLTSTLGPGATITVNFSASANTTRAMVLGYVSNVAASGQNDATTANNTFSNTEALTHTTVAANAFIVASVCVQAYTSNALTTSIDYVNGASFTQSGAVYNFGTQAGSTAGLKLYVLWKQATTAAAYSAGGQFQENGVQHNETYLLVASSYKP
jgi:hypothetical protein